MLASGLAYLSWNAARQPRKAATAFGVGLPSDVPPTPYMAVKAGRDATCAAMLAVVARYGDTRMLQWILAVGAISPIVDATVVARHGEPRGTVVHLMTVALIAGTIVLARNGR